ncbi:MAG: hypothetical protein KJ676_05335 [Alphaproteobacteria bacterium]|nr:hypothetical protein [Alphaproteobacteria bacterium]MBU1525169.1 hypothetical protein [Alphaproteobacteria bacterium]MBU2117477.1 hypothetical protein [Alphaproteobacteria bacterium]MBU2381175.1 hypothetical protein [Alphaproteobacteria bacterium]
MSGLTLDSEIALPSLFPCGFTPDRTDVELRLSPTPLRPPVPDRAGANWAVTSDRFWLDVTDVGEFLAEAGRRLWVHPTAGGPRNDEAVSLVVAGTAMAALLHQRNGCVFHASAVDVAGRAVLFMAPSGHGKSTLAARLTRQGHSLIADDFCRIDLDDLDAVRVHPDGRRPKLWRDAVDRLHLPAEGAILPLIDKFYVGADRRAVESEPIAAVYLMRRSHEAPAASITAVPPSAAVGALLGNAFRPRQIARLGVGAAYLQTARALASAGKVFDLVNPFDPGLSGATTARLMEHWAALGLTRPPPAADRSNSIPGPARTDGRDASP